VGRLWEIDEDDWRAVLDTNLTGVWRTLKATVPTMIDAGRGGSIVTIGSAAGLKSLPGQAHYSAAKHGVVGLTGTAALELAPYDIRANSVHPWAVDTAMSRDRVLRALMAANAHYATSFAQVGHCAPRRPARHERLIDAGELIPAARSGSRIHDRFALGAVDGDVGAVDVARARRGQEHHEVRDLLGRADPTKRQ